MFRISDPGPAGKNAAAVELILLRDAQRYEISPAQLCDEQARRQVVDLSSTSNPAFVIPHLRGWDDDDRWIILRLVAGIPTASVRAAGDTPDTELFQAILALMVCDSDVERCGWRRYLLGGTYTCARLSVRVKAGTNARVTERGFQYGTVVRVLKHCHRP